MSDGKPTEPRAFRDLFEGCVRARTPPCECDEPVGRQERRGTHVYLREQGTESPAWQGLLRLADEASRDGREARASGRELGQAPWSEIVTLPASISSLERVRHFDGLSPVDVEHADEQTSAPSRTIRLPHDEEPTVRVDEYEARTHCST